MLKMKYRTSLNSQLQAATALLCKKEPTVHSG